MEGLGAPALAVAAHTPNAKSAPTLGVARAALAERAHDRERSRRRRRRPVAAGPPRRIADQREQLGFRAHRRSGVSAGHGGWESDLVAHEARWQGARGVRGRVGLPRTTEVQTVNQSIGHRAIGSDHAAEGEHLIGAAVEREPAQREHDPTARGSGKDPDRLGLSTPETPGCAPAAIGEADRFSDRVRRQHHE